MLCLSIKLNTIYEIFLIKIINILFLQNTKERTNSRQIMILAMGHNFIGSTTCLKKYKKIKKIDLVEASLRILNMQCVYQQDGIYFKAVML